MGQLAESLDSPALFFDSNLALDQISGHFYATKATTTLSSIMSVLVLGETDQTSLASAEEVKTIGHTHNLTIPPSELQDWAILPTGLNHCAKEVFALPDYYPPVDTSLYLRTDIHHPSGTKRLTTEDGQQKPLSSVGDILWAQTCSFRCLPGDFFSLDMFPELRTRETLFQPSNSLRLGNADSEII